MANRNLLPKHFLDVFKKWLTDHGYTHRPGRGHHQVLQVQIKPPQWHVIYERETRNPHYTVPEPLRKVAEQFIYDYKYADYHPSTGL